MSIINARRELHFSDETHARRDRAPIGQTRRITIAARSVPDNNSFDWINKFATDYAPKVKTCEIKSSLVTSICNHNARAKDFVVRNIRESHIYVIDVFSDYYDIVSSLSELAPDSKNVIKSFAQSSKMPEGYIRGLLSGQRREIVYDTIVPRIGWLISEARNHYPDPDNDPLRLFTSDQLDSLSDQQFQELLTRFTVLFAEAVNPEVRAKAIVDVITPMRCVGGSHYVASQILEAAVSSDVVFDAGAGGVIDLLRKADEMVQKAIETAGSIEFQKQSRSVAEADSQAFLGIQAADIAAGIARQSFESHFRGETKEAALRLRDEFARVLFNTRWL